MARAKDTALGADEFRATELSVQLAKEGCNTEEIISLVAKDQELKRNIDYFFYLIIELLQKRRFFSDAKLRVLQAMFEVNKSDLSSLDTRVLSSLILTYTDDSLFEIQDCNILAALVRKGIVIDGRSLGSGRTRSTYLRALVASQDQEALDIALSNKFLTAELGKDGLYISLLHYAASFGNLVAMRKLYEKGAKYDEKPVVHSRLWVSLLETAVTHGHYDCLKLAIEKTENVDVLREFLIDSIKTSRFRAIKIILDMKVLNLNCDIGNGKTFYDYLIESRNPDFINHLMNAREINFSTMQSTRRSLEFVAGRKHCMIQFLQISCVLSKKFMPSLGQIGLIINYVLENPTLHTKAVSIEICRLIRSRNYFSDLEGSAVEKLLDEIREENFVAKLGRIEKILSTDLSSSQTVISTLSGIRSSDEMAEFINLILDLPFATMPDSRSVGLIFEHIILNKHFQSPEIVRGLHAIVIECGCSLPLSSFFENISNLIRDCLCMSRIGFVAEFNKCKVLSGAFRVLEDEITVNVKCELGEQVMLKDPVLKEGGAALASGALVRLR